MIRILETTLDGLSLVDDITQGCWVNVFEPDLDELREVSDRLEIPLDFLTDALDVDEMSRVELEDNAILMILRAPRYDTNQEDVPFTTLPIGVAVVSNVVVTVCALDIRELLDLFGRRMKNLHPENRNRFILQLFHRTAFLYLNYLKEINRRSHEIESELQRATRNDELMRLLDIEKSLVFLSTSLRSNDMLMERLRRLKTWPLSEDDTDFLEDVIIDNKQAIEMASVYSNILSSTIEAFASVISNNLNTIMKFLTSVTIILTIPVLIASLYGMNVGLPFQNSPHAFFITIGISMVLSLAGVLLFLRNKWL